MLNLSGVALLDLGSHRMRDIRMDGIDFVRLSELSITASLVTEMFPAYLRILLAVWFLKKNGRSFSLAWSN